jgi:hypothetical protein
MDNILRLVPWLELDRAVPDLRILSDSLRRVPLITERADTPSQLSLEPSLRRVEPFD